MANLQHPVGPFVKAGGGALIAFLFFWMPYRQRKWHSLVGLVVLATLAGIVSGCGVSKSAQHIGGTTAGVYAITVTGTSGTVQSTTNVSVTVQ
jgi:drug/metabolite transporter (DMT)-like permease